MENPGRILGILGILGILEFSEKFSELGILQFFSFGATRGGELPLVELRKHQVQSAAVQSRANRVNCGKLNPDPFRDSCVRCILITTRKNISCNERLSL